MLIKDFFYKFGNPDKFLPLTIIREYLFHDCLHLKTERLMDPKE